MMCRRPTLDACRRMTPTTPMLESDFTDASPGYLVPADTLDGSYWPAFVPDPLLPAIVWQDQTVMLLSKADRALSRLDGRAADLPNPHLMIGLATGREAIASSSIEGTSSVIAELYQYQAGGTTRDDNDAQEVHNYVRALNHGLARLHEMPICLRLIREVHEVLMSGVRGRNRRPGEFRTRQAIIRGNQPDIQHARFVPPPANEMLPALYELARFLQTDPGIPLLVQLALIHYQFEAIHPFEDGNGRTGRVLTALLLCNRGYLERPWLYLSDFFLEYREHYVDLLLNVSLRGEWTPWVDFFLMAVAAVADDAFRRVETMLHLRNDYRLRVQGHRASGTAWRLIDEIFGAPYITARYAQTLLNVTHTTAQSHINRLVEAEILAPASRVGRTQLYVAQGILDVIAEDPDFRDF